MSTIPMQRPAGVPTPLLGPDSPLDARSRALVQELFDAEARLMDALPTDDPKDAKRRRRVDLTRPEILAQPDAIRTTLAMEKDAIEAVAAALAKAPPQRIVMTGCGDSLTVMIGARLLLEQLLGIPCEPVQALDFAYYGYRTVGPGTLLITLSSSGMTTRTVEAMLVAKAKGARTLALSNTVGSALMAESDLALRIHAERKGWPTQASTAAMALLMQLGIALARALGRSTADVEGLQAALDALPSFIASTVAAQVDVVRSIAGREASRSLYLFAGGGPSFASALFGAAKVKECTPDHAIAIPQEEFHHYNSLKVGDPLFIIAPAGPSVARARDTAFEGRRWGGQIYSIVTEGDDRLDACSDVVLTLPTMPEALSPLVSCVPVQLFAYHLAITKFDRATA
jgi:glucosamine--fructose-6-phosphate aminotransferase (isomerizing)